MKINLTDIEKKIVLDFVSCAIGEGYTGGGQFDNIDLDKAIIDIGIKFGMTEMESKRYFEIG